MTSRIVCLLMSLIAAAEAEAGVRFVVEPPANSMLLNGRLVVFCTNLASSVADQSPSDGPFWDDPQPMFGRDVSIKSEQGTNARAWIVDDNALSFDQLPSKLPPGKYKAQAVFDHVSGSSSWKKEAGNYFSKPIEFEVTAAGKLADVNLSLTEQTEDETPKDSPNLKFIIFRSKLLSDFRHTDVFLRAGVVLPTNYDPKRKYAAIYEVPGFGGDHTDAVGTAMKRGTGRAGELDANTFYVSLDPESPNGHTLFADSRVNGPCGAALVRELIPELEKQFPLAARPEARILRGHSSGGWSTIWLATTYPDVFGACFSSSPDPVDFRKFELVNLYEQTNFYWLMNPDGTKGEELPSTRTDGKVTLTVRQENLQEEILHPDNAAGQQWDSWQAVWGTPDGKGRPKPLYDAIAGGINKSEIDAYKAYDMRLLLHNDPKKFGPLYAKNIRIIVGDADDYYLNEAVHLLDDELKSIKTDLPDADCHGYVKFVSKADHGTIYRSPEMRAFSAEMLDHLKRNDLLQ